MTHSAIVHAGPSRLMRMVHEVGKFGAVGAVAYVVDVSIFNLLRFGVETGPLKAKTVSTLIAVTIAYFGNRHWTWRDRRRTGFRREYMLFAIVNGAGLTIQLAFLGFTVYALGLHGQLAENISGNLLGVLVGTFFRFWAYRKWVFPYVQEDDSATEGSLESTTITPY